MQRHFRKSVWLAVASLVILSLTIGSALAHEGRPVGDYRFVVGWQEEPAYEGVRNAASVQISKVVTKASPANHGGETGGHSSLTPAAPKVLASVAGQHARTDRAGGGTGGFHSGGSDPRPHRGQRGFRTSWPSSASPAIT